jgi:hypothetical protein
MNELIKRLRAQAKLTRRYCPHEKMKTLEENAADAIEKLQAENERLKRALQEWIDGKCISEKYLLMIGRLQRDVPQNCEYCRYKRKDGGCKLLPDGDAFSPDYTEVFDRDDCEHWEWRGAKEA